MGKNKTEKKKVSCQIPLELYGEFEKIAIREPGPPYGVQSRGLVAAIKLYVNQQGGEVLAKK